MNRELTLMAVHAHPDDEVLGTGGLLARCAAEGVRTVLVTCTNGEQGDDSGGVKPGEPGHDAAEVAQRRLAELRASADLLDIDHLELLGYRDSGMAGWAANDDPDAFANVPLDESAGRLAELMEHYRPQVVVTYDENGGYGHPDHIQAHRIALAAAEKTGVPDKLYFSAIPRSGIRRLFDAVRTAGVEIDFDPPEDFGTPDELITSTLDVSAHVDAKRDALRAHASQGENIFLLRLPDETQRMAFSFEAFVRHYSRVQAPDKEDDLFAGLR
ncbi:LmbE family N-acetylglucosaminyl deacetylase [Actinomadura pelletieri DSM 43383]|uniref:LmbE family N-acetylglucosaminyl deacetylase n=1 Tax=Actinomadura pelletieri DSM 43383 TaxID=1120940 RepID=A0A495QML4_9ACTN|nr:PIG-L family deacetylase [Actinomadura pelletieri]RKS74223.1 LmbE family N-acetylglucosaminyl deacetylase [Actinomadura pelletieri DSM 43383]